MEREDREQYDHQNSDEFNHATLIEIEVIRGIFMWLNGFGPLHTWSNLDRIFMNDNWLVRWPHAHPTLLNGTTSIHVHSNNGISLGQ